jgi:hypothetical protein
MPENLAGGLDFLSFAFLTSFAFRRIVENNVA